MFKNSWWIVFLIILSGIVIWFSGHAVSKIYHYSLLNASTKGSVYEWAAKQVSSNEFRIQGHYSFHLNDELFLGSALLHDEAFRNEAAAMLKSLSLEKNNRTIWYDPNNPFFSQLDRLFPLKECIYMGILISLLLYFIFLGFRVRYSQGIALQESAIQEQPINRP